MTEFWGYFFFYITILNILKGITIGSDFNVVKWFKYGKLYTDWYDSRENWDNYIKNIKK